MEPIQDDIETWVAEKRSRGFWHPEEGHEVIGVSLRDLDELDAALDRLVAERDRLLADVTMWHDAATHHAHTIDHLLAGIGALVEKCRDRAGSFMDVGARHLRSFADELEVLTKTTEEPENNEWISSEAGEYSGP